MDLRWGHLAMLVAVGFLDNLQLEADGTRILVKCRTSKETLLVETTPDKEVYRERLRTTVVALDLDIGEITGSQSRLPTSGVAAGRPSVNNSPKA